MTKPNFETERDFIDEHFGEIKPLLNKDEQDLVPDNEADADTLLERYRTKLFYEETASTNPKAARVLLTGNDPGGSNVIMPLIAALEQDPDCRGIGALVSGLARKTLETQFQGRLAEVKSDSPTFMQEVLEFSEQKPFDVVVGTVSGLNGPESLALYGGRSNLKAKKVYLIAEGWGTLGSQFASGNHPRMDEIEVIFCADEVAKSIFWHQLPNIPESKFVVIGSPVIDGLRVENPAAFAEQARRKFGLDENTLSLLFVGDISFECQKAYGCDELVNEKTFAQTLNSVIKLAVDNPDQQYALLVRPHPRDPNKNELFAQAERAELPKNLKVIPAGNEIVSIQEARYAADAVMSMASTENFLAPRLGRTAIFLGYKQEELGGKILDTIYGQEIMEEIASTDPKIHIAASPEQVTSILKNVGLATQDFNVLPVFRQTSSVERIKDRILG